MLKLFFLWISLAPHLKTASGKSDTHTIRNIDFIYMINLDQRPEKWHQSMSQLALYGIEPYRFSAVNGWELTLDAIQDVGVKFAPGMQGGFWATTFRPKREGESSIPAQQEGYCGSQHPFDSNFIWEQERIGQPGTVYFCHCMERGTIGIALSHISILNDALNAGYETIWVMEDDIEVMRDPAILSELIDQLDLLVDKDWDILFTDKDIRSQTGAYIPATACAKRPNFESPNDFTINFAISQDLRRIGARYGAHSMILRRSGIQKLLQFFNEYKIFLPYDMEYTLPPGIKLYTVLEDVVTNLRHALSDNGCPNYLNRPHQ